ncbi:leucine-rich repeat protein [Trichococcus alkaliphilus]|uniref:leucine-rich repeat protein n=1 Tax=Trichococcus alkaliphilus TaxID=2052943 RepID=UPI00128FF8BA|nr:leucine-rich repeat protein [Trichococcus alkaliphilus]
MRKVLHKVKSQWVVLGVMGATVVSLGTANIQKVSAAETENTGTIETIEQTGSPLVPDEPITISTEEPNVEELPYATAEVADSNLEQGETSLTVLNSAVTTTPANEEIIAVETEDVTAPVIDVSSISLVKTTVTQGNTVNISVNITDDAGIASASLTYVSPITEKTKTIALYKNEISGLFEGAFTVSDSTELGVWKCSNIEAYDTQGNSVLLSGSDADLSRAVFTVNETPATTDTKSVTEATSVDMLQASAASEEVTALSAAVISPLEVQEPPVVNLATEGTVSTSVPFDNIAYATNAQTGNTAEYARGASGLQWVQVDLGASYDLREIKLWHYFGEGRIYKDVVAQLSNDATFSSGAVTVFNNDKDGSAGLGVGADSEYSETSAGKTIVFDTLNARYARFYSNGSTVNGANHYVEIEVYGVEPQTVSTTNLIPEGTLSSSVPFDNLTYAANTQADNTAEYARGTSGLQWVQADLGASYDINEINLWHYFGDGRSYHDVVVQLSNDATFSNGAVTIFNNDKDGSAGLGVGTDGEYSETSAGKKILFDTVTARYARFYSNGSTVNGANHYVEIEVFGAEPQAAPTVNLAPAGTITSSVPFDNSPLATDLQADSTTAYARGTSGLQWMQVDLGASYDLDAIKLWHYFGDGRSYHDVVVQLSDDATFASGTLTVFNNDKDGSSNLGVGTDREYSETSAGKTISFNTISARYARFYSNGSTVNGANHYVEIEVYGNASTKTEYKTEAVIQNVVHYTTIELLDNTLLTGETQLIQTGLDGYDTLTYEVIYTNGVETSRAEISRETTDVVNEIIRKGTKVVETKTETATENNVAYTIVEQQDDTIPAGERKIVQKGSNGYDTVSYAVTYTNGVETNRLETSRQTIQLVDEIVKVGTQVIETKSEIATENVVNAKTIEISDSTLPIGERKVIQSGRNGYDKVTYTVTYTNGSETSRTEVNRKTITVLNEVVKVGTQVVETKNQVVTENEVAYQTVEQLDNTLQRGKREVIQTGSNGFDKVTYAITYTNGLETGRIKLASVTTATVNEVVKVGTKVVEKKVETVEVTNGTAPEIIEITDSTLLAGERIVIQKGESGYDLITFEVIYTNGAETGRTEVNRETIASVNEFVKVGTKIVGTKMETVTENIVGYTTTVQDDDTLPTGETEYALVGANGYDTVTYEVTYINGLAASRKEISRVTTSPVNETIRVGTQVIENKTETATENELAFTTIELEDDTIPAGTREILQAGSTGYDVVTYDVTYTNGFPTNYRELSRETVASVNEIVKVGTQVIETVNEVTNENIIGYTTLVEEDVTLSADESVVFQTGANGFDAVTYEVTYTNGVETSRVEVSRQTTAPLNQIVKVGTKISVTNISVTSEDADSIILNGSTLQMAASISPDDATATEVTWSIEAGTGTATIDNTGLLTAMSAGTVTVKAIANDGSGIVGSQIIEIAAPISIIRYNGSNSDVVIPELLDGSLAQSSYGYINNYGYTYYSRYNEYDVLGELAYGNKGIVTSVDYYTFGWKQLTSVVIPDSVTSIGQGAFTGNQLTSVTIPISLISIGDNAFSQNQLTSIDIPNSVVSIGSSAFYGNQLNSVNLPDRLVSIGGNAFGNNQLTSIDIPNSVISIGESAFSINQLTSVTIPDSITSIQDGVFSNNQLVSVDIPDGVTSIGAYAFRYNQLVSVGIPDGVTSIGAYAFYNNQLVSMDMPDGVTNIGDYAFYENQLVSIDIPNGVASIGAGAFYNNHLISVNMPEGLTNIGESAFGSKYGTNQLTSVTIPSTVTKIGAYAFNNNRLTSIVIPNGVINIAPYAFNGNQLTSVIIPESVTSIGSYAFNGNRLTDVTIPSGVTSIGDFAFYGNQITKVAIPNSVKTIGKNAFYANGLKNVDIPDGVTSIGEYAFSSNQLTNVVIPTTIKIIGDFAFYANQLKEVFVPVGVTRIEDYAFGANRLTRVVIPGSVTSIGNGAFSGNQLTSISIPKSVTVIGNDAFSYNQFTSIVIPDSVKVIGSTAFMGNQVSCITLGAGVQIGENALTYDNKFREAYKIGGAGTYILTSNGEWKKVEVTKETETATENLVDYVTNIEEDLTLATDESTIYQVGVAGYDTVTYEVMYSEGTEISRVEVNRQTTSAVTQIIKVGKKVEVSNITVTAAGEKSVILNGDTLQMSAAVLPEDANMQSVIWSVENGTGAAAIDRNGLLTAASAGTVTVKATANDGSNVVGSKVIEIAVPLTVIKYNGSDSAVVIPEIFDGSQAEYKYGYIEGYGYTNYYTYISFDLLGALENGHKGIVTGIDNSAFGWKQLTSVVIPDSVTNIGKYAFNGNQLTSVVIPENVTSIGEYAFNSNQFIKVVIPDSVTSIGVSAFSNNQLTNIVIPKNVTAIGDNAFSYNQLKSIIIPDSVKTIGSIAFYGNQISCITLGGGVQIGETVLNYDNKFREVYNVGGAGTYILTQNGEWIKVEATIEAETVAENIVDYVTIIEEDLSLAADESTIYQAGIAGYDTVMYEVIYNEGAEIGRVEVSRQTTAPVKQIIKVGNRVEVTSITVTAAGEKSVILNGDTLQMSAAVLPEDANMLSVIWSIENGTGAATIDRDGLLTATNAGTVTVNATANDGSNFVGSKVIEIAVPLTVINYNGSDLDVVIPEIFDGSQVESTYGYIDGRGYTNYYTYNGFGLWGGLEYEHKGIVTSVDNSAFAWKQLTSIVIPDSVTSIGNAAFYYNQLTSVNLPVNLISIGENAFGSNQLTSLDIPDSVTSIGNSAFYGNQLTDVVIPSNVASIGSGVFSGNQLTSVTIADGITSIGDAAFSNNQLTNLTIPDSVTSIGGSSFSNNQLTSIIIPEGVTNIGDSAFSNNQLMSVTIPTSVTSIGNNAFQSNHLLSVVIPVGVTSIGSYAFYDNQLTIVEIPEGVTNIGSYAFGANPYWDATNGYGNQLTNVIIPSSVTNIGDNAFIRNKLTGIVIPEGVLTIGSYAFYNNQLTSVVIPTSATSIGDSAFEYNQLTSVVIPEGVTTIGNRAFSSNQLTSVDIPTSVTSIGSYAFYNNQLTNVTIPEGVTSIGEYAFYANRLTSVDIPDTVTTIENNAFEYNQLTSVEISNSVTSIGTQAFNSNQLTSVVIPEGVTSIGNNAFSNNLLSSVEIPSTVSIIGTSAFYNNQLTEIVIPDSVTTIGSYAFQGNQLTNVVIPEGVTFIGNGAFSQNQFSSITIGEGVQVGDSLLGTNNNFRSAYTTGGAGTYTGTQDGEWIRILV